VLFYFPHIILILLLLPAILPCLMLLYLIVCFGLAALLDRIF
jgi:hypothetical protein